MRDALLFLVMLGLLPVVLLRPHVGIMAYAWFSLMNPHRLTWGPAYDFPFGLAILAVTVPAWILSRERKFPRAHPLVWLLLLFAGWFTLTTLRAWAPEMAWVKWEHAAKIVFTTLLALALLDDERRLRLFVALIALSVAFYGIKGGLFTLLTGGHFLVWGPAESYIADNNALALGLVMVLPLLVYLYETGTSRLWRLATLAFVWLTVVGILGTESRGGAVTLAGAGVLLWLRTRHRLATGLLGLVTILFALAFMPEAWFDRMATIGQYDQDGSANLRFMAWAWARDVAARSPLTGGGFYVFTLNGIVHQQGQATYLNAHSIYFEVLAEHGYIGLALFLALLLGGVLTARRLAALARGVPELDWAERLGALLQVSFFAYALGGALLNMAFYDLFYYLLAVTVLARWQVADRLAEAAPAPPAQPAPRPGAAHA